MTDKKKLEPGRPFRSKLRPFIDDIRRWRRAGLTWVQVANRLGQHGCDTHPQNVCQFMLRYRRRPYASEAQPEEVRTSNPRQTPSAPNRGQLTAKKRPLGIQELIEPAETPPTREDAPLFKVVEPGRLL